MTDEQAHQSAGFLGDFQNGSHKAKIVKPVPELTSTGKLKYYTAALLDASISPALLPIG